MLAAWPSPRAILSCVLRMRHGTAMLANLPVSKKATAKNWDGVVGVLPHAVAVMHGGGH